MTEFYIAYPPIHGRRGKSKRTLSNTYGTNAIYAGKHPMERRKDSEFWHLWVAKHLREQGIKPQIYDKPVEIICSFDDKLDCDNHSYILKLVVDSLKGYLLTDDSRKYVKRVALEFNSQKIIKVTVRAYG